MKTDIGIDTGDMILQKTFEIDKDQTCGELFDKLSDLGAEAVLEALSLIVDGKAVFTKQNHDIATTTKMIKKEDARIDWSKTSFEIVNQIRAFNPAPIAFSTLNGENFKIYSAKAVAANGKAGEILDSTDKLIVGTGDGAISLLKVQKAGSNAMEIKDFLRGNKLSIGEFLV